MTSTQLKVIVPNKKIYFTINTFKRQVELKGRMSSSTFANILTDSQVRQPRN
jgi:hypothetical protein